MQIFLTSREGARRRPAWLAALAAGFLALGIAAAAAQTAQVPVPKPLPDDDAKFYAFIQSFRHTALEAGIRRHIYDRSMKDISRSAHIQDLNNKQPEFARPVWDYLDTAVSDKRIQNGRDKLAANATMLANLEARYGVPKEILVAIWGLETNYGQHTGRYNMFEALATLGYNGRRADFGRRELIAALKMEQREGYDPKDMVSSWAGAFGETQFTPSTFLEQAVDGDGDGKIDLWNSPADALASTASMLQKAGWQQGGDTFYEVTLPANFPYVEADPGNVMPLAHWRMLGVTTVQGNTLPESAGEGAIFLPAGAAGPAFLIFHNFHTILRYNNATSYALAVSYLAKRIAGGASIVHSWPRDEEPLSRADRMAFQESLKTLGFDPGDIDGILGKQVREALRNYQRARGLPPDGFATQDLLKRMEREIAAKGG